MKKQTGKNASDHYWSVDPITGQAIQVNPEFNRMSLKPGIGATFAKKYIQDIYPHGHFYINGQQIKPPRYYDKIFKSIRPIHSEQLQHDRLSNIQPSEQTPQRLADKELIAKQKLTYKIRKFS
jgi:hypothetical protein